MSCNGKSEFHCIICHEGKWEARGIALLFLKPRRQGWGWVFNATPWPLYPRERPVTHGMGGQVSPKAGLDGGRNSRYYWDSIPGPSSPKEYSVRQHVQNKKLVILLHELKVLPDDEQTQSNYVQNITRIKLALVNIFIKMKLFSHLLWSLECESLFMHIKVAKKILKAVFLVKRKITCNSSFTGFRNNITLGSYILRIK